MMVRVFPRRTKWTPDDDLVFIGDPPLFRPLKEMPVRVSVTFTQDIPEAERLYKAWSLYYSDVKLGGPALGDPGDIFTPGMFIKKGVVITSRGCIRSCPWCLVPEREGQIREYLVKRGHIIQDNNLLACSPDHIRTVFAMLEVESKAAIFSGGLDARLLSKWHVELFKKIRIKEMWFACDSVRQMDSLLRASKLLKDFPAYKKRCYVLMGYGNETLSDADDRARSVYELGFMPFAQLYKGPSQKKYEDLWKNLARYWARPAIYKSNEEPNG